MSLHCRDDETNVGFIVENIEQRKDVSLVAVGSSKGSIAYYFIHINGNFLYNATSLIACGDFLKVQ